MALNPELRKMVSTAKSKYSGNSGNSLKPKEGRNTYRIIAPTPEQASWADPTGKFWADLGVHWIKADPNGKPIAVVGDCDTVYQQPSVINTAVEMAINNAHDEESKKLYEEWKARKSVLLNIVDRSTGNEEVLEVTPTTFGKVLDLYTLYADAGQDITDPLTGSDIVITRTGKGLNTNYDVAIAPNVPGKPFEPVTAAQIAKAKDLNEFIAQNFFRGEEQKALNAIAQIAGIAVPRLAGTVAGASPAIAAPATATRTPTAALASPAASVAEPVAAPAVDPVAAAAEQRRKEILQRQAEAAAELAALESAAAMPAAAAATATPAAVAAVSAVSAVSASDQDAILAELDNLT